MPPYTPRPMLPSPCRQICQLDDDHRCIGCARTRGEIAEWGSASLVRQAEILENVQTRRDAASLLVAPPDLSGRPAS